RRGARQGGRPRGARRRRRRPAGRAPVPGAAAARRRRDRRPDRRGAAARRAAMSPPTVLVVHDEPFIGRSLSFVLRKGNYNVVEARNGEEALAAIRKHRPDLVFMDVMMPKVSGFVVCGQVKADPELKHTKIILLTAKGQD